MALMLSGLVVMFVGMVLVMFAAPSLTSTVETERAVALTGFGLLTLGALATVVGIWVAVGPL